MSEPELNLDDVLPRMVVRTGFLLERHFAAALTPAGITVRQFGILSQFIRSEALTAAEVSRALQFTPQSIGPQIDVLHEAGLLTRTSRPGRGRPNELRLTEAGRAALARALEISRAEQARLTEHMTPQQQRAMLDQLREMANRARTP